MARLVRLTADVDHWVNPAYITSVIALYQPIPATAIIRANVDVKVEGMPLHRIVLGEYDNQLDAVRAVEAFIASLND